MRQVSIGRIFSMTLLASFLLTNICYAGKTAREIDTSVDVALEKFEKEVFSGKEMLKKAKGVLVFPSVIKAGIGLGGEYGVGALRVKGKTVEYYNTVGASIGFQLGGQAFREYLLFMDQDALDKFTKSEGWKAGVDGSIALIKVGADGSVDTTKTNEPILGFVLGQKGLMYNLNLEGSKYNKIKPE